MKQQLVLTLAVGLIASLASAAHAEHGTPSSATLKAMGLSSMTVMTDREAMEVRGKFALVGGASYSAARGLFSGAADLNFYFAAKPNTAFGVSGSVSSVNEVVVINPPFFPPFGYSANATAFSGGFAFASGN